MTEHQNRPFPLKVQCYAGYRGEETPRRFILGEKTIEVAQVIDRWLAPDHGYFKVFSRAGETYILRQDVASQEWELVFFEEQRG